MSEPIRVGPRKPVPVTGVYRLTWEDGDLVVRDGSPVECRQVAGKTCSPTNNGAQVWEYHRYRSEKQWRYDKRRRAARHRGGLMT